MAKPIENYPTGDKLPRPWATWIPDRLPQFKMHESLTRAKCAMAARYNSGMRGGVLYQFNNDQWQIMAIVRPGSHKDDYLLFSHPKKWSAAPGITILITENPYD